MPKIVTDEKRHATMRVSKKVYNWHAKVAEKEGRSFSSYMERLMIKSMLINNKSLTTKTK